MDPSAGAGVAGVQSSSLSSFREFARKIRNPMPYQ